MSKYKIGNIEPFWDGQYKDLHYIKEPFNDQDKVDVWRKDGYVHPEYLYTGMMCKHVYFQHIVISTNSIQRCLILD